MKRALLAATMGLLAFSGPCFPDNYFSYLAASSGSAILSALLSDVMNTVFPAV